jgi:hypothetical protein
VREQRPDDSCTHSIRYTTEAVETALSNYWAAIEVAVACVRSSLMKLSEVLCDALPSIVQVLMFLCYIRLLNYLLVGISLGSNFTSCHVPHGVFDSEGMVAAHNPSIYRLSS